MLSPPAWRFNAELVLAWLTGTRRAGGDCVHRATHNDETCRARHYSLDPVPIHHFHFISIFPPLHPLYIMSLWWGSDPFADLVAKATSELLPAGQEDIALNLEICDQVRAKQVQPKHAMQAIKKRISDNNPNVVLLALGVSPPPSLPHDIHLTRQLTHLPPPIHSSPTFASRMAATTSSPRLLPENSWTISSPSSRSHQV